MKLCTSCDAQFPDEITRCIHCGRGLDPEEVGRKPSASEPSVPEDMVLYREREPLYAPPLLDALRSAGIRFLVIGDAGSWAPKARSGSSGHDAKIEIYVDRQHLDAAHAVETELMHRTLPALAHTKVPEPMSGDRCPACDHALADEHLVCPDCGLRFV